MTDVLLMPPTTINGIILHVDADRAALLAALSDASDGGYTAPPTRLHCVMCGVKLLTTLKQSRYCDPCKRRRAKEQKAADRARRAAYRAAGRKGRGAKQ